MTDARIIVLHVDGALTRALDVEAIAAHAWASHLESRDPPAWRRLLDGTAVLIVSLHEASEALAAWRQAMTTDERALFERIADALGDALAWAGPVAYYTGWVIVQLSA